MRLFDAGGGAHRPSRRQLARATLHRGHTYGPRFETPAAASAALRTRTCRFCASRWRRTVRPGLAVRVGASTCSDSSTSASANFARSSAAFAAVCARPCCSQTRSAPVRVAAGVCPDTSPSVGGSPSFLSPHFQLSASHCPTFAAGSLLVDGFRRVLRSVAPEWNAEEAGIIFRQGLLEMRDRNACVLQPLQPPPRAAAAADGPPCTHSEAGVETMGEPRRVGLATLLRLSCQYFSHTFLQPQHMVAPSADADSGSGLPPVHVRSRGGGR